jgi:coenzyme F420-0:L-glutamate ligase/coenzyme F420-1:gamma-L-glutamate ligase
MAQGNVQLIPIIGIGEIGAGDNVAGAILEAAASAILEFLDGDVLVVTHKIISKAEGKVIAITSERDYRRLVESEAEAIIRRRGDLVITQTKHGFICANAGVDRSNVREDQALLLPDRPDRSAHMIRKHIEQATGVRLAVVVSDTFGRAWRRGLTDVAIGVSGMPAILDLRGTTDMYGRVLEVTEVATVDEIAAAADLVMGKASGIPAAIVRGVDWVHGEGQASDLVRTAHEDLFR